MLNKLTLTFEITGVTLLFRMLMRQLLQNHMLIVKYFTDSSPSQSRFITPDVDEPTVLWHSSSVYDPWVMALLFDYRLIKCSLSLFISIFVWNLFKCKNLLRSLYQYSVRTNIICSRSNNETRTWLNLSRKQLLSCYLKDPNVSR